MGVKFYDGTNWKNVALPAKYSTDGGTTWIRAKRLNFYDPITGNYMKGVWGDLPPANIVSPAVTFTWTGSAYTAKATWTQITDTEGDFSSVQVQKVVTGGATTTSSIAYSSLTHPLGVTNCDLGTITEAGYTQITWSFRIVDAGGQTGTYAAAAAVRVPPSPVTGLTLAPFWNGTKYVVRASWTAPTGTFASYRLVHNKGAGDTTINGITATTYDIAGTANEGGSTYTVSVYTIDAASTASPVTSSTITLPPDPPATAALTNLNTATATLTWTAPTNAVRTGYRYRFSTDGGSTYGAWTEVGSAVLTATRSTVGLSTLHAQVQTLNTPSGQTNSYETTTSGTIGVPAPVTPVVTFANGVNITVNWSGSSTTNVNSWSVFLTLNGGSSVLYGSGINPGTTQATYTVTLNNATLQTATVVANHVNGSTASTSGSATTPTTVASATSAFVSRAPTATWTHIAGNTGYTVSVRKTSDNSLIESANVGAVGTWSSSNPTAYVDLTTYTVYVQGFNAAGSAVNTAASTNIRKIPSPLIIEPDASDTWRNGSRRFVSTIYQGQTVNGANYGALYYGNKFYDLLNSASNGYSVTVSSATIFMARQNTGNSGTEPIWLTTHTRGSISEADPTSTKSVGATLGALTRPDGGGDTYRANIDFGLAIGYITSLINQTGGVKGLGLFDSGTYNSGTGFTPDYTSFEQAGTVFVFVGVCGAVTVYHNG